MKPDLVLLSMSHALVFICATAFKQDGRYASVDLGGSASPTACYHTRYCVYGVPSFSFYPQPSSDNQTIYLTKNILQNGRKKKKKRKQEPKLIPNPPLLPIHPTHQSSPKTKQKERDQKRNSPPR
jgi:hypothetical protein